MTHLHPLISCLPLVICLRDRPATSLHLPPPPDTTLSPSRRICLTFLVAGSAGYFMVDQGFEIRAYVWLLLWYGFFVFDTVSRQAVGDINSQRP